MARDRKRAKQRQQRRPLRGASAAAPAEPTELHRADLPGALEHASGEVDEFDAALVRGAGGSPAAADAAETAEAEGERERERAAVATGVGVGGSGRGGNGAGAVVVAEEPEEAEEHVVERHEPRRSLPARAVAFLRASWAELQRVQWPDRPQVSQATAVVLGFVVVAGIYLGAADWVAQKIVNLIL
ncbi:MAG TPA: preprotein translocase subunit SecE [Solirubrobacteraceae bacterium]|jgi:preprotein translocase subunit SecE|nr:preprotein translocase subunit SecE [Solirubrobacteraceae bacterium]